MENVWVLASVWVGLALIATLGAIWLKMSTALSEIVVGTVAQLVIGAFFVHGGLAEGDAMTGKRQSAIFGGFWLVMTGLRGRKKLRMGRFLWRSAWTQSC
jgi:hypothetical protein